MPTGMIQDRKLCIERCVVNNILSKIKFSSAQSHTVCMEFGVHI